MRKGFLAAALLVAGGIGGAAQAQQATIQISPDAIIAGRQGGYALMGGAFRDMANAAKAKADPKPYVHDAEGIVDWSHAIPGLFPPGTEKGHKTKALPAIWSNQAGFEKAAANFQAAAAKLLAATKSGDRAAYAQAVGTTVRACKACHREFRAE